MAIDNKLNNLKIYLPKTAELFDLYLVTTSIIHLWSWIWFFFKTQSLLNQYSLIEFVSVFAYLQVYCFIESIIIFLIVTILSTFLLLLIRKNIFLSQATIIIIISSIWMMLLYLTYIYPLFSMSVWGISYLFFLFSLSFLNIRFQSFDQAFKNISRRFFGLGLIFLFGDVISVVIILIRNIF